jgi:hypothetical protein
VSFSSGRSSPGVVDICMTLPLVFVIASHYPDLKVCLAPTLSKSSSASE